MRGERSAAGRFRQNVIRTAAEVCETSAWAACDLVPSADDTRALARRRSTAAVSVPGPFPINRRCAGFRVALVPAMAAIYGGLPVIGAGRSTGASRAWLRVTRRRRTTRLIGYTHAG